MIIKVSKENPRIRVNMSFASEPEGGISLYMKRAGEAAEFAVYFPLEVKGGEVTFQLDDLVWVRTQGRYVGRLTVGEITYGTLDIEWKDQTVMLSAENANAQSAS